MRVASFRAAIIGALCAAALLLAGCSALRFAYNQGHEFVYWWLDGYADFDDAQTARVREAIDGWFRWNRTTQLGDYAALLARAEEEIAHDASAEQMCRWNGAVRERALRAFDAAVPAIAAIAPSLSAAQLEHIGQRFAERNADFRHDYRLDDDAAAQQRASLERTLDRAETLYGRLDDAQRERLARAVAGSPFDGSVWLAERRARQADILDTLRRLGRERLAPAEAQQAVRAVAERMAQSPRPAYRSYEQTLTQYQCTVAAELHNATTPAQRQAAQRKLRGWQSALRSLIADAAN